MGNLLTMTIIHEARNGRGNVNRINFQFLLIDSLLTIALNCVHLHFHTSTNAIKRTGQLIAYSEWFRLKINLIIVATPINYEILSISLGCRPLLVVAR